MQRLVDAGRITESEQKLFDLHPHKLIASSAFLSTHRGDEWNEMSWNPESDDKESKVRGPQLAHTWGKGMVNRSMLTSILLSVIGPQSCLMFL